MDSSFSNGYQLENKPTHEPFPLELGSGSRYEITNPNQNLSDEHSSQILKSTEGSHSLQNETVEILRYIDQFLMEDDLEPHIMHQGSSDFRAKERIFYEAVGQKYPPSPQQESPSLNVAQNVDDGDDVNNTDEAIIEKSSHSEAMDNNVLMQEFDDSVWMYTVDEKLAADMATMQITGKNMMQPGGAKIRAKKRNSGENDEVVDFRALLTDCANSVSSGDRQTANDLLRQIWQHSSPHGNRDQRLAYYFANGLEARLSGIGCEIYRSTDTSDYLRVYRLSSASSPMRKISNFASNEMIAVRSKKAARIHIIDFGILYGFQWPSFIRRMAEREGGSPDNLRITGIEFPQMAGIIEDTGRRLACYAETLGVPFEYKAVAREWETIKIEDMKIEKGEYVAVVCSNRSMKLLDLTVGVLESPKAMFLKLIKEINPDIFVHGIINAAFNQPLFVYRFRELMLHYMTSFDMLETFVARDKPERMMIERDLLGKEIFNAIACEGSEGVDRPETHMQWQLRHVEAGFMRVSFKKKLMDAIFRKVDHFYHRDFLIFEENQWLMMSWKGRVIYAISCWQLRSRKL